MKKLAALLLLIAAPAFGQSPAKMQGFIYVEDAQGHAVSTLSAYSGSSAATRGSTLISKAASGTSTQVFHLAGTSFTCGSIPSTTPMYKGQGPSTVITISGSTLSQLSSFIARCSSLTVIGSDGSRYLGAQGQAFTGAAGIGPIFQGNIADTPAAAITNSYGQGGLAFSTNGTASLGNQYYSPSLVLSGNGWSTGSSASQAVDWRITNVPVQGGTPTSTLLFDSQINGGGYTNVLSVNSTGYVTGLGFAGATGVPAAVDSNQSVFVTNGARTGDSFHLFSNQQTITINNTNGNAAFADTGAYNVNTGVSNGHANSFQSNPSLNGVGNELAFSAFQSTSPTGTGPVGVLFGLNVDDYQSRYGGGGMSGFSTGAFGVYQQPGAYKHPNQPSSLGDVMIGMWAPNPDFRTTTSNLLVGQPDSLNGSATGTTWPGIFVVGRGAVGLSGSGTQFGTAVTVDRGGRIGGGYTYKTGDFIDYAIGGCLDFFKTDATSAHSGGYISIKTNDNASDAPTTLTEHARLDSSGLKLPDLTASQVVMTNASKYLTTTSSPTFTTQTTGDNSTKGATTAYADRMMQPLATIFSEVQSNSTSETTLWDSAAFPRSLSTNGDTFHFRIVGTIAAHASRTREIKLYFRYNTNQYFAVGDTGAIVVNVTSPVFVIEGTVTRRSSGVNPAYCRITINGATGAAVADSMGYNTFGADIQGIKVTGQCGAGSANGDISLESGQVWFGPKEP